MPVRPTQRLLSGGHLARRTQRELVWGPGRWYERRRGQLPSLRPDRGASRRGSPLPPRAAAREPCLTTFLPRHGATARRTVRRRRPPAVVLPPTRSAWPNRRHHSRETGCVSCPRGSACPADYPDRTVRYATFDDSRAALRRAAASRWAPTARSPWRPSTQGDAATCSAHASSGRTERWCASGTSVAVAAAPATSCRYAPARSSPRTAPASHPASAYRAKPHRTNRTPCAAPPGEPPSLSTRRGRVDARSSVPWFGAEDVWFESGIRRRIRERARGERDPAGRPAA